MAVLERAPFMSKEALKAFGAKLAEDENLRTEMTRSLSQNGTKSSVSAEELATFAKGRGYDLTPEEIHATMELSEEQLESVAGGIGGPGDFSATFSSYSIESISFNFSKIRFSY